MTSHQSTTAPERPPSLTERELLRVIWGGVAVAILFTAFRFYIRLTRFGRFFIDDAFVSLALLILIASAVLYKFMTATMYLNARIASGLQTPPPDVMEVFNTYLKLQFATTMLFWTCLWAVKFAFLAFFHKLGQGLRAQKILWNIVLGFTIFAYIGCVISYPIACSSFVAGKCSDQLHIQRSLVSLRYSTAIDIISDAMIIVLPINLLWKVQINRREKAALVTIFSLGMIIMIFAIIRVCKTNRAHNHPEPIWLALWSAIESSVAVIVSCLASFKTLVSRSRDSRYVYRTNQISPKRRRRGGMPLVPQVQHSVTVRAGSVHRQPSVEDSISDDEGFRKPARVHVKTDFEVTRSKAS